MAFKDTATRGQAMIKAAAPNLSRPSAESVGTPPPAGWEALRADSDIRHTLSAVKHHIDAA